MILEIFNRYLRRLNMQVSGQSEFKVFTSVKDVPESWNEFLPAHHLLQTHQLRIVEECNEDGFRFYYLIVPSKKGANKPIAVVYFQLLRFNKRSYNYPATKNWFLKKLETTIMNRGFSILVCGNLFRLDAPGIYFDEKGIKAEEIFFLLEKFFKQLPSFPHAILIKDVPQHWDAQWQKTFHYLSWSDDLTMKLNIHHEWKSMDDYVHTLKHRYAQRYRKARKHFQGIERRELNEEEIKLKSAELHQLYLQVVHRQSIRMGTATENYFHEMKIMLGEQFKIFGYFLNEKLIAFSSNITYDDLWEAHYIGIDYSLNETHWIYFNILFDSIELAIHSGKSQLELGRTAREAKANVGCQPVYFFNYVRFRNGFINRLVQLFKNYFNSAMGETWKTRKPFRTT